MESNTRPRGRRDDLIEKAGQLFAKSGYEGTTVRQIAQGCGITEAAIYKHFDGKHELYCAVIQNMAERHGIRKFLDQYRGQGDIEQTLFTVARHILETVRQDPDLLRMFLYSSLEGFQGSELLYQEFRAPYIQFLTQELETRIEQGEVKPVKPFISARCFVGTLMDCALNSQLWNYLEQTCFTVEEVVENNVPIFAAGLRAR